MTLEPNGYLFLVMLLLGFAGLVHAVVRVPHLLLRGLAGVLALAVGATSGVWLVNRYYDYFTSWTGIYGALTNAGAVSEQAAGLGALVPGGAGPVGSAPAPTNPGAGPGTAPPTAAPYAGSGTLVSLTLPGTTSHLTRNGYVYLPPQYRDPRFADVRFPVVELLHGDPGNPGSWVNGLQIASVLDQAITSGQIGPLVAVMPASFTGSHGQECLDAVNGAADDTYLSKDVPADLQAKVRVQAPGTAWAVAGLSDGGFCAANLSLRHPDVFGAAAVMSGYFRPELSTRIRAAVFGSDPARLQGNDPTLLALVPGRPLPTFWISAGTADRQDYAAAEAFATEIQGRTPVTFLAVRGGAHTTPTWRTALAPMLQWVWAVVGTHRAPSGRSVVPVSGP